MVADLITRGVIAGHIKANADAKWITRWEPAAMSFDIIILKPTDLSENDLSNVEDVLDIGCP
ncbi:hypothetical protein ACM9HO_01950, partial [Pseudomonas sp. KHB2.9]